MRKLLLSFAMLALMSCAQGCEAIQDLLTEETLLYGTWSATQLTTEKGDLFFGSHIYSLKFNEDGSCAFIENGGSFQGMGNYEYDKSEGRILMRLNNTAVDCICYINLTCDVQVLTRNSLRFSVIPKKEYEAANDAAPFVENELETWYFER